MRLCTVLRHTVMLPAIEGGVSIGRIQVIIHSDMHFANRRVLGICAWQSHVAARQLHAWLSLHRAILQPIDAEPRVFLALSICACNVKNTSAQVLLRS